MTTFVEREYSFAAAARILGLPESKLRYWSQSGFVGPSLRKQGRQVFSFQDLISVRAAKELVDRGFQPAQIRKALEQVRSKLPSLDRPLEKLRVTWDGSALALVDDGATFEVSGQRRFDFGLSDLAARAAEILALSPRTEDASASRGPSVNKTAFDWFADGLAKEGAPGKETEAETCYRKALESDPGLAAAHTNLGGIAHRRGDVSLAPSGTPRVWTIPELIALSQRFLGLPYTWGGTSSFGYDCSGFTQMLCRRGGVLIPRDADVQAAWSGMTAVSFVIRVSISVYFAVRISVALASTASRAAVAPKA